MQHKITFHLQKPLTLPINYQCLLQGLIYSWFSINPEISEFLHNSGVVLPNGQSFKLFGFSLLSGNYSIQGKTISFTGDTSFELRTPVSLIDSMI